MMKDLRFFRRNVGKKAEVQDIENLPPVGAVQVGNYVSTGPLSTIQEPAQNTKSSIEQELRLRSKIDRTPTKVQGKGANASSTLRTPEKQVGVSSRNKFGWAQKNEAGLSGTETRDEGKSDVTHLPSSTRSNGGLTNMTPRSVRSAGRAMTNNSECSSTQSTPTKSVTKPPNQGFASLNSSRPPVNIGARVANFAALAKGVPISCAAPSVVNTVEVPHYELREDPSFWMDHNVQVLIRVRPLNSMERSSHGYSRCLKQESAQSIAWVGQPETRFTFDHVACETVNQEMLFRVAGLPMVENCLSGYNSCMFAYGQTGSGKTYTMLGEINELEVRPSPDRGMTPRIFEFLFARIRAEEESRRDEKLKYNCKCSFLEIYNEQITDLLDPLSTNLLLREDIKSGVYVENLTEYDVQSVNDILKLLTEGAANRKVAATNMNRESSRSHSVFTCVIESRWEKDSAINLRFARLNLVDLAGSERQKASGAEGERLKEAANINKSLSTLGHVIMLLVDVAHGKSRHIPYRDSRLTFLLQESLGGNSKTMIVANVSPSICCAAETLTTLKFAQRAKLIQNNAVINEDASGDVSALQHQIQMLKEELCILKHRNVPRSLSFRSTSLGDTDAEGDEDSSKEISEMAHDSADDACQGSASLGILRVSTKQLKSLEATLAGALRREQMADNFIKQLEAEIEQLNRLANQREEDTRCSKMKLRFREDKIRRMELLLGGSMPSDAYMLEENNVLSEELQLLRVKIDRNPEVTRFALENIRLLEKLRRFQDFYEEGEREMLLAEVSELRNQLLKFLDGNNELYNYLNADMPYELKKANEELEQCRNNLNSCLDINTKLTREINDLHCQLSVFNSSHHDPDADAKRIALSSMKVQAFDSHLQEAVQKEKAKWRDEAIMKHTEDITSLQLELDILKSILQEERSFRAEVEERALNFSTDLEMAKARCLEISMSMNCEDLEDKLQEAVQKEKAKWRDEAIIKHTEDITTLQLELDILKTILQEERSSRTEVEERALNISTDLEMAKARCLEISMNCEDLEEKLKESTSVIEALESQQLLLINELDGLRGNNSLYLELLSKQEQEASALREQVCCQDIRESSSLEHSESKDSNLQVKLNRMQASLQKAKRLNTWYQSDQAFQTSHEQEKDEVRRQVEAETAEVIICLQEELTVLQQQVKDCNQKEMETKQSLLLLENELNALKERLCSMTEDNQRLNEIVQEKDEELKTFSEEWETVACEIEEVIADGHGALEDASIQVNLITSSFSPKNWIHEQVGKILRDMSEKDSIIEEMQRSLEEAHNIRIDMDLKLRSLRGATLAITEAQQQESSEKDKEILHLTSQLNDKSSIITEFTKKMKRKDDEFARVGTCATVAFVVVKRLSEITSDYRDVLNQKDTQLIEYISLNLKKDALFQDQVAAIDGAEQQIHALKREIEVSEESCVMLKQKLSEEEKHVHFMEMKLDEVEKDLLLKTREKLDEFKLGVSTLNLSMNKHAEHAVGGERVQAPVKNDPECVDTDSEGQHGSQASQVINKKESQGIVTVSSLKIGKDVNGFPCELECPLSGRACEDAYDRDLTILLLRKEIESALESFKGVQDQMVKLLEEKEDISNSEKRSRKSMEGLSSQLLALQTEICGSEKQLKLKIMELEHKLLKLEESTEEAKVSWHQKEEVFDLELSDAKVIATQKTAESASLIAKFEEAQETMKEADMTVNALVTANDTLKLEFERLKEMVVKLTNESDFLTTEVQSLQLSNDQKDQLYANLENQFLLDLSDIRSLVLALDNTITEVQTVFMDQFESMLCDFHYLKSQILHSTNLTWSWLEDIWCEIIVKDCAVSVLHLCHMGVLLDAMNELNAENGLLHHQLCESNCVIMDLKVHNFKATKELEMFGALEGKLLVDIKNSFDRILRKEDEAGKLSSKLSSFEKKILELQSQEELMLARSNSIGSELSHLMEELDLHNTNAMAALSDQMKLVKDKEELTSCEVEFLTVDLIAKDFESLILASELLQMGLWKADLESEQEAFTAFLEDIKKEVVFLGIEADFGKQLLMITEVEVTFLREVVEETNVDRNDLFQKLKQSSVRLLEVEQDKKALEQDIQSLREVTCSNDELKSELAELMESKERLTAKIESIENESAVHIKDAVIKETALKASFCELEAELDQKEAKLNELCSIQMENETLKNEVRRLKAEHENIFDDLQEKKSEFEASYSRMHALDKQNQTLQAKICSLEDCVAILQSNHALKNEEFADLQHSQSFLAHELSAKQQDLEIQINLISSLKKENASLRSNLMSVNQKSEALLSLVSSNVTSCVDLFQTVDSAGNRMFQVLDGKNISLLEKMFDEICGYKERASDLILECECLESFVKELTSENLSFQAELLRKDEVLKGLLFDLSLLQESASAAKDQKDEVEEMAAAVQSLENDLALTSSELDEAVVHNQMLEAQLQEKLALISDLELDLFKKCESLELVMDKKVGLKTQLEDVLLVKDSVDGELRERNKALERLEEESFHMDNALGQMNIFLEGLKNDLNKVTCEKERLKSEVCVLTEKLEMTQALAEENEARVVEAQQIADSRKTYAEEKEEEVKLLERSVEELESTVNVLENKVDIVKGEAERQTVLREELETELQVIRNQMITVTTPGESLDGGTKNILTRDAELQRHLEERDRDLQVTREQIKILEKNVAEKNVEISQCRMHISELNLHAEAQAQEYKEKFKTLEAMAEQVKSDPIPPHITNSSSSTKLEKNAAKSRGSGSPFKCIGLGLSHQINSEKDEELTAARRQIEELDTVAANQQKELFKLKAKLAAAESLTHDVIRDLLGVKLDMNHYASLLDHQQVHRIVDKARVHNEESLLKEQEQEVITKLKQQLNEFVEERQGWIEEINRRHAEIVAAQIASEKLRQRDQFLTTENDLLKKENVSHKKKAMELEDEVKKLSGHQNLQQRIHHHAKIKEENNLLKTQNEDLSTKLRRMDTMVSRLKEELARYRASNGRKPFIDFDEEQRLNIKLQETKEEKFQLATKLLNLCTSILKAAGITRPAADVSPSIAEEALEHLKDRTVSLERELHDLRHKNRICNERVRLFEVNQQSRANESCTTPERAFQTTTFFTALDR